MKQKNKDSTTCLLEGYLKLKKHIVNVNTKERVEELIENNKAFSCSGLYLYMGSMVANSKDVLEVQKGNSR